VKKVRVIKWSQAHNYIDILGEKDIAFFCGLPGLSHGSSYNWSRYDMTIMDRHFHAAKAALILAGYTIADEKDYPPK
jgi:hypothetical protein